MPFNGSGVYSLPSTTCSPAVADTVIDPTEFNTLTADLATAISLCLTEDGQNVPTANLPMGGFKHTGAAAGVAATDYSTIGGTETLTNKTLTSPVLNGTLSGTAFLDEDDMASNSAIATASQQSIKAYSDSATQTLTNKTLTSPTITNPTITSPTITSPDIDQVVDSSGNEVVIFAEVASAVNEITETNAASGNKPSINQTGTDDVGLDIEGVELHNNNITTSGTIGSSDITSTGTVTSAEDIVTGAAATTRPFYFKTSGSNRWLINANASAESGSDAGSDFGIARYSDAGALLGTALTITRSNGKAVFTDLDPASLVTSSTIGAVGTYAFLGETTTTTTAAGSTQSGSNLRYAGFHASATWNNATPATLTAVGNGGTPSGTWQCMGYANGISGTVNPATIWLRIA